VLWFLIPGVAAVLFLGWCALAMAGSDPDEEWRETMPDPPRVRNVRVWHDWEKWDES
jgi:hypothetical protein